MKSLVVNIVSGKGGTGKTIFSTVLADALGNSGFNVLVVDLDIFVRGLTTLLFFHKNEKIRLMPNECYSVSDILISDKYVSPNRSRELKSKYPTDLSIDLGIAKYRTFDVLPSVSSINEILSFNDIMPDNKSEALRKLSLLTNSIESYSKKTNQKYDIIILDSRAGYDELVSATHRISDISICIQEEDEISLITTDNLIRQLEDDKYKGSIFRITNKARNIKSDDDLRRRMIGIDHIGVIPFDIDIMNSFGSNNFWDDIPRTLYRNSLIKSWNLLNEKLSLNFFIEFNRNSPLIFDNLEKKTGMVSYSKRILLLYSIVVTLLSVSYIMLSIFYSDTSFSINQVLESYLTEFLVGFAGIMSFSYLVYVILSQGKD